MKGTKMDDIRSAIEDAINERRMEVAEETRDELRSFANYPDDGDGIIDTLRDAADKLERLNDVMSNAEDFLSELEDALG